MIKKPILLFLLPMLLACGNSSKPAEQSEFEYVEAAQPDEVDTLASERQDRLIELPPPPRTPASPSPESKDDYDNMRGFDPASEDDMPDNGMSRYMENDDEEGWD